MGDDATAGKLDRLLDGWAGDRKVACGLAHEDKCRQLCSTWPVPAALARLAPRQPDPRHRYPVRPERRAAVCPARTPPPNPTAAYRFANAGELPTKRLGRRVYVYRPSFASSSRWT